MVARRGWLGPGEVLNTLPLEDLKARFDRRPRHDQLAANPRGGCAWCHEAGRPADTLHARTGACGNCHRTDVWRPATWYHAKFRFDRNHPPVCETCHPAAQSAK